MTRQKIVKNWGKIEYSESFGQIVQWYHHLFLCSNTVFKLENLNYKSPPLSLYIIICASCRDQIGHNRFELDDPNLWAHCKVLYWKNSDGIRRSDWTRQPLWPKLLALRMCPKVTWEVFCYSEAISWIMCPVYRSVCFLALKRQLHCEIEVYWLVINYLRGAQTFLSK